MKTQAKRSFPYVTVALIAVAVLVLFIVVYTILGNLGVIGRMTTMAQTTNYSLNQNEMRVFEYQTGLDSLYQQWMYYAYYNQSGASSFQQSYPTPQDFIYSMMPTYVAAGAYDGQAAITAGNYLLYCELANAENFSNEALNEQIEAEIDASINLMKENASALGISLNTYLNRYMGNGVSKKDVRNALRVQFLAAEYMEARLDEISDKLTEEELKEYREANKSAFYSTKYNSYQLSDEKMYNALKDQEIKTLEDMQLAIVNYLVNSKFDDLYKTNVLDKTETETSTETGAEKAAEPEGSESESATESTSETESATEAETTKDPDEGLTEEQKAAKAECKEKVIETILALNKIGDNKEQYTSKDTKEYPIVTTINTTVSAQLKLINEKGSSAYQDLSKEDVSKNATDLNKWLFDTKTPAKADDWKIISQEKTSTDSNGKETKTTTYTWYLVKEAMVIDEEKTKEAYYILLKDDTTGDNKKTAEEKADALLEALKGNLNKSDAELLEELKSNKAYKAQWDNGSISEKYLKDKITPGNFDLLASAAANTSGNSYYYESIKDARDEKNPAATDSLYKYLFDSEHEEGDYDKILSTEEKDGKTTTVGYYVVYFVGENEETWMKNARSAKANEEMTDILEQAKKTYALELVTEAETTAATK